MPRSDGNLAGIQNLGLAWDRVLVAPTVAGDLTGVEATVGTVRGDIKVGWSAAEPACGSGREGGEVSLAPAVVNCSDRGVIEQIVFADYGIPTGDCGSFQKGNCSAANSMAVVKHMCLGKPSCTINASSAQFGYKDPCPGMYKRLAVQAVCSGFFSLDVQLPVGVADAEVRLPLGNRSAAAVTASRATAIER